MDYQLTAFVMLVPVAIIFYNIGRATTEYPSEEVMIRRIIEARMERYRKKWTTAEVEKELEEASLAAARRS